MNKVYLITTGEQDVVGISSTPEIAQAFIGQFPDEQFNELREITVDDLVNIPRGKYPYFLSIKPDALSVSEIKKAYGGISIYNAELIRYRRIDLDIRGNFIIYVWAKDKEEAKKLALELLESHLESGKEL